jgi:hypothetical protein
MLSFVPLIPVMPTVKADEKFFVDFYVVDSQGTPLNGVKIEVKGVYGYDEIVYTGSDGYAPRLELFSDQRNALYNWTTTYQLDSESGDFYVPNNYNSVNITMSDVTVSTPSPTPTPITTPSPTSTPTPTPSPTPSPTTTDAPSPTPTPTPTPTSNPTSNPTANPTTTPTPTPTKNTQTPTPTPTPTQSTNSPSPSPSIPEFPIQIVLPSLLAIALIASLFIKKKITANQCVTKSLKKTTKTLKKQKP